jgi:hypothetical protein
MLKTAALRLLQRICFIWAILISTLICLSLPALAEPVPAPVTPSTVTYQIEHSKSPEQVGQQLQQQSQDYKQELKKSPTPIPNAAKNAANKTRSIFQQFSKRTQETLDSQSEHQAQ